MNSRENLIALLKREPYEWVPAEFNLCPSLYDEYVRRTGGKVPYPDYYNFPWRGIGDIAVKQDPDRYKAYHPNLKKGGFIDGWGVGHEPGSAAAKHMTYMRCPLRGIDSLDEVKAYPLPDFAHGDTSHQKEQADRIKASGLAALGSMQCTIWETAWYIRGMEDLMVDMMSDDPIATYLLDAVTECSVIRASAFAKAGVDMIYLGDDIGMQSTGMMSLELYRKWLMPRLKQVIDAARKVNPNVIILYHSCGHATPYIPSLIEAGVDVLNPVQPESMDFKEIYNEYGGKISFHGTIGTQTTMPFGTPEEVRATVFERLDTAVKGGLFVAPTHLLEPEVPWENIEAYVQACADYKVKR